MAGSKRVSNMSQGLPLRVNNITYPEVEFHLCCPLNLFIVKSEVECLVELSLVVPASLDTPGTQVRAHRMILIIFKLHQAHVMYWADELRAYFFTWRVAMVTSYHEGYLAFPRIGVPTARSLTTSWLPFGWLQEQQLVESADCILCILADDHFNSWGNSLFSFQVRGVVKRETVSPEVNPFLTLPVGQVTPTFTLSIDGDKDVLCTVQSDDCFYWSLQLRTIFVRRGNCFHSSVVDCGDDWLRRLWLRGQVWQVDRVDDRV